MSVLISHNPATETIKARVPTLTKTRLKKKMRDAAAAFPPWSNISLTKRLSYISRLSKLLLTKKTQLATLTAQEMGKPVTEAHGEVEKCAWLCDVYAQHAAAWLASHDIRTEARKSYVCFEPLGIILGVMPWNFPLWQVFRFAIPTLAAGNVVLIKHASNVPRCAREIEHLFHDAGFPRGVYTNLFLTSKEVPPLIADQRIAGVSLTGSVEAGKSIAALAGASLKKCVLELGGSDPFIVLADADLESAAITGVQARCANAGQSCIAAKRFVVVKHVAKEFESLFVQSMQKLKIGDPLDSETQLGPLAREDLLKTLERQVHGAVQQGARVLCGGCRLRRIGFYYAPTVLANCSLQMDIASEEIFGPVACIYTVRNEKEALALANATRFGLGTSIWTRDKTRAVKLARQIESGFVVINGMVKSDPRLPFGGIKDSGIGRELGEFGIREFVNVKTVVVH